MSGTSGPSLPIPTQANAQIGSFIPGQQIADIPALGPWDTIISQYANSPGIPDLIVSWFAAIDKTQAMDDLFDNVWNPETANGYGLDIWGRIVGVGRVLTLTQQAYFGFAEAGPPAVGWSQGPFYAGKGLTYNYKLDDVRYRNLIFAKALANICDGSTRMLNRILMTMFPGRGNCWVALGSGLLPYFGFAESASAKGFSQAPFYSGGRAYTRGIAYTFTFPLTAVDYGMISSGVIPKPPGIPATIQFV